ncbi:hypothetical protein B0J15DRAFT_246702 [Fusarium solani]|uniref:Uncharacterized protein n=1 Tax=Fusarium solani TaxID=169388 RepID=A0A9P9KQ24_FUSSL|nr:uncharacterized protein B0J15DRAFT_246702 [Fusarium solani]KAH7266413.1 hypothetical protein B0J15DRAFT_246702 [Fusarium solani]
MELTSFTSWLVPGIMAQAGAAPGLNRASLINHLRAGVLGGNRLLSVVAWRPLSMLQNPARLTHPLCKLIGETFQGDCLWNTRGRRFSHFSSNLAAPTVLEQIDIPPTCLLGWSMNHEVFLLSTCWIRRRSTMQRSWRFCLMAKDLASVSGCTGSFHDLCAS